MSMPSFIDPAETPFAHARTDVGSFDKMVEMNDRLRFVPEPLDDTLGTIIIVGLQRSGTTLTHQLAAAGTDAGYVNNLIARFWESPAYGVHLFRHLGLRRRISFESVVGNTEAVTDVHEFGYFWAKLLGTTSNAALADVDPQAVDWRQVRDKLLSINAAFGRPTIHKSTLAGHFMPHLCRVLDRKLFVYVKRDFLEIASSILKVRRTRYGDVRAWWSLKPYEYEAIKDLSPHEQVVAQIAHLHRDLERQAAAVPAANLWEVHYRDLCARPQEFLRDLRERAAGAGISIELSGSQLPGPFKASGPRRDDEDVQQLAHLLDRFGLPYER